MPETPTNYALVQDPHWERPDDHDLDEIHETAQRYLERFNRSGGTVPGTKGERYREEISGIIGAVESLDRQQQDHVLRQLGIHPLWYQDHGEIPGILDAVASP